jgi:hypothetical protein
MSESKRTSSGISFFTLLGLMFITLKLTKVIDWSWWYVTLPLWGIFPIILLFAATYGIIVLLAKK